MANPALTTPRDLVPLVRRTETSRDPRIIYTLCEGKLYALDVWAIRGHDDFGQPFPSEQVHE